MHIESGVAFPKTKEDSDGWVLPLDEENDASEAPRSLPALPTGEQLKEGEMAGK